MKYRPPRSLRDSASLNYLILHKVNLWNAHRKLLQSSWHAVTWISMSYPFAGVEWCIDCSSHGGNHMSQVLAVEISLLQVFSSSPVEAVLLCKKRGVGDKKGSEPDSWWERRTGSEDEVLFFLKQDPGIQDFWFLNVISAQCHFFSPGSCALPQRKAGSCLESCCLAGLPIRRTVGLWIQCW